MSKNTLEYVRQYAPQSLRKEYRHDLTADACREWGLRWLRRRRQLWWTLLMRRMSPWQRGSSIRLRGHSARGQGPPLVCAKPKGLMYFQGPNDFDLARISTYSLWGTGIHVFLLYFNHIPMYSCWATEIHVSDLYFANIHMYSQMRRLEYVYLVMYSDVFRSTVAIHVSS